MLNETNADLQHSTMTENIALEIIAALAREGLITRRDLMEQFEALLDTVERALTHALEYDITRSDMAGFIGARLGDEPRRPSLAEMCDIVDAYRRGSAAAESEGLSPQESLALAMFRDMPTASQGRMLAMLEADQDDRAAMIAQLTPDQRGQLETLIRAFEADQDAPDDQNAE